MQERAWEKRGEQYLLIKSPTASGKSRALMFIALDKLENQGLRQAVIVVPACTLADVRIEHLPQRLEVVQDVRPEAYPLVDDRQRIHVALADRDVTPEPGLWTRVAV